MYMYKCIIHVHKYMYMYVIGFFDLRYSVKALKIILTLTWICFIWICIHESVYLSISIV